MKKSKNTHGGARPGAGRNTYSDQPLKNYQIKLTAPEHEYILKHHKTFTKAVRSLLPIGWEVDK